jgi:hypothetical protein
VVKAQAHVHGTATPDKEKLMPHKNKEDHNAYHRAYKKSHRAYCNILGRGEHARRPWIAGEKRNYYRASVQIGYNRKLARRIYEEVWRLNQAAGKIVWNVDHIVPLSLGGVHHEHNLQILTARQNVRKGDKI